ncbi:hypothetical protein Tco_1457377 [Tanacetum coccineum]
MVARRGIVVGWQRVDRVMGNTFRLGRNTRRKSFPAAAAVADLRRRPEMGRADGGCGDDGAWQWQRVEARGGGVRVDRVRRNIFYSAGKLAGKVFRWPKVMAAWWGKLVGKFGEERE